MRQPRSWISGELQSPDFPSWQFPVSITADLYVIDRGLMLEDGRTDSILFNLAIPRLNQAIISSDIYPLVEQIERHVPRRRRVCFDLQTSSFPTPG